MKRLKHHRPLYIISEIGVGINDNKLNRESEDQKDHRFYSFYFFFIPKTLKILAKDTPEHYNSASIFFITNAILAL